MNEAVEKNHPAQSLAYLLELMTIVQLSNCTYVTGIGMGSLYFHYLPFPLY